MARSTTTDRGRGAARAAGPVQVAPGIVQVAGSGLSHPWDGGAFLLTGPRPFLVDAGTPRGFAAVRRNIEAAGVDVDDIEAVIATHGHYDHVGAAARLAELGVPLWIHGDDRAPVESGDPVRTTAGLLYRTAFPPASVGAELFDGDVFDTGTQRITVVHTPGHTPGSVCVLVEHLDRAPVLLAGDTLWGGWHPQVSCDLETWARSLERLTGLDFDGYAFGHGEARLSTGGPAKVSEALHRFGYYLDPWFVTPPDAVGRAGAHGQAEASPPTQVA